VWEGQIDDLREHLWEDKAWSWGDIDDWMTYMCFAWGYDLAVRVSECTLAEKDAEDQNIRAFQVVLRLHSAVLEDSRPVLTVRWVSRASKLLDKSNVLCIEVESSSHEVGYLSKKIMKVIGRRSEAKNQWCDDLVEWITKSGITTEDPLFCRY
jgi:hypothetical protein